MRILEFENPENKKIMLIHGMQTPWQVWTPQIEFFSKQYHVLVPVLSGHDSEEKSDFSSISEMSEEIENHCINHFGNEIFAICGMSMGGAISAAIWQNGKLNIQKLVLEGAPLVPLSRVVTRVLINQYLAITHNSQKQDEKTLRNCEKMFLPKYYIPQFLEMIDKMSDETVKNCVSETGCFRLNSNIDASKIDIAYFYGTALNEMLAKKSAKFIQKHYPNAKVKCFKGYRHCELSIYRPKQYIEEVACFLKKQTDYGRKKKEEKHGM